MMINVIGIGPGSEKQMTLRALEALKSSHVIVGYTVYVDLVKKAVVELNEKELISTAMKKEKDRCRQAVSKALEGKNVAVVCSGDSGIYGMASLIYQLASEEEEEIEINVIPGITAASSGAALLGAPLTHDFAVISLSDLLTPWELIEKRIRMACQGDFAICIYNPSSKKRHDYLSKACKIMMEYRDENTVCGIAYNIDRDGEGYRIMSLEQLRETEVDMFTTVFIGNSRTENIGGKMVTPRGYFRELMD